MNKKILLSIAVFVILGIFFFGQTKIFAYANMNAYPPIIQKIAEKFGLKTEDVKSVFDEVRKDEQAKRQVEWQNRFEQRLNEDVKSGKLTESQKQAIIKKMTELKEKWEKEQNELEAWAKENNIDLRYMMGGRKFKFGFWGKPW